MGFPDFTEVTFIFVASNNIKQKELE